MSEPILKWRRDAEGARRAKVRMTFVVVKHKDGKHWCAGVKFPTSDFGATGFDAHFFAHGTRKKCKRACKEMALKLVRVVEAKQ